MSTGPDTRNTFWDFSFITLHTGSTINDSKTIQNVKLALAHILGVTQEWLGNLEKTS